MARRVLVSVCGGIAAYKVCEVVSTLAKAGVEVRVILTESAERFITPLTFATLCRHPAYTDRDIHFGNLPTVALYIFSWGNGPK